MLRGLRCGKVLTTPVWLQFYDHHGDVDDFVICNKLVMVGDYFGRCFSITEDHGLCIELYSSYPYANLEFVE